MKDDLIKFYVRGEGVFPLELLAYDRCHPMGLADTSIIASTISGHCAPPKWEVALVTVSPAGPTLYKWKEHGCTIRYPIRRKSQSNLVIIRKIIC